MKLLSIIFILVFAANCSKQVTEKPSPKIDLPEVRVHMSSGIYNIPGCPIYDKIPVQMVLVLPTAQEAQASGYFPAAGCPKDSIQQRLEKEREAFGEFAPNETTEKRREQILLRRQLN